MALAVLEISVSVVPQRIFRRADSAKGRESDIKAAIEKAAQAAAEGQLVEFSILHGFLLTITKAPGAGVAVFGLRSPAVRRVGRSSTRSCGVGPRRKSLKLADFSSI